MASYDDIRARYLGFFADRGHAVVPSASLVPQNDPTTLFTGSGMQPMVPYLLGETHAKGARLADSQKCFRAEDIEEVGDNRHTTFFEMLGNWSFGDYFKEEQIEWIFTFLVEELKIDPNKLYVTVFGGDAENHLPRDEDAPRVWQKLFAAHGIEAGVADVGSEADGYARGMRDGERIFYYDASKNWWSRAGVPAKMPAGEPGGPDSEMFYDFGTEHDPKYGEHCHPNCDCGRFMEIGNSVFMQYVKKGDKAFEELKNKNIDFGGGLERIAAAQAGNADVFTSGVLGEIVRHLEKVTHKSYEDTEHVAAFRVVADHVRAAVFLIGDGVLPGNVEQGYFVRRLLRRAIRYAGVLGVPEGGFPEIARVITGAYKSTYGALGEREVHIVEQIAAEENKFRETLTKGMQQFEKLAQGDVISGEDAFVLFSSHGFPVELTQELARERGATVDMQNYHQAMKKHQETSRAGAEQKFKGGLADHSEAVTRLHTAHHLLLKALQIVLGDHVKQRGSNITGERLRIDFSHGEKMTDEQKKEVENIVNEKIGEELPVTKTIMPREEAEKLGAEMEFGQKYPDEVSVYSVGPKDATKENPKHGDAFSIEFCGGPHVSNTSEIGESGVFKIKKEEASSAGVRRIKAILDTQ